MLLVIKIVGILILANNCSIHYNKKRLYKLCRKTFLIQKQRYGSAFTYTHVYILIYRCYIHKIMGIVESVMSLY